MRVLPAAVSVRCAIDGFIAFLACVTCVIFILPARDVRFDQIRPHLVARALPSEVPRYGRLRVLAKTDAGAPVSGAQVQLFVKQNGAYFDAGHGRTDASGLLELEALPEGKTWVLTEAPQYARASTVTQVTAVPSEIVLELEAAHVLTVSVLSEREQPISGATVLVQSDDPLPFGAVTDGRGQAVIGRLPGGSNSVQISARGFESLTRHGVGEKLEVVLRRLGVLTVLVQMPDGSPAAGAEVWASGSTLWPSRRATAKKDGTLSIVGLLAGQYELRASYQNAVSTTLVGIELERGQDASVTVRLALGRRISVLAFDEASPVGDVVEGADVVLVEQGISPFPLQGRTNSEGLVTLGPVSLGPASVSVRADGFVPSNVIVVPDRLDAPMRVGLLRGATLRGRVVDERGFPIASASIEIVGSDLNGLPLADTPWSNAFRQTHFEWALAGPLPLLPAGELGVMPGAVPPIPRLGATLGPQLRDSNSEPIVSWASRDTGYFAISPVNPGRVRALVRHPAFLPGLSEVVALAPGGSAEVIVMLRGGGNLEGRLLDFRDMPVGQARIEVHGETGLFQKTTYTEDDGSFSFAAVPKRIVISVSRPEDSMRPVLRKEIELPAEGSAELVLHLPESREPVEVLVVNDRDVPLEGVEVTVASLEVEVPLRRTVFTAADGRARLDDVLGLKLSIVASLPGWLPARSTLEAAPALVRLSMGRGFSATGRVTAVRGRQYVSGATVTLIQGGQRHTVIADATGRYTLDDVEPGSAQLRISHPDYAPSQVEVHMDRPSREGREVELPDVDLSEAVSVSGVVVDAAGVPVSGARVGMGNAPEFLPLGGVAEASTLTDVHGNFVLSGLPSGGISLEARAEGLGRGRVRLEANPGQAGTTVRITLSLSTAPDEATNTVAPASVAITLGDGPDGISVLHVAAGSEAERAGLRSGDLLKRVDGSAPRSSGEARGRLSGPSGSHVLVDIIRSGSVVSMRIVREQVRR